jgi:hypothetical protein
LSATTPGARRISASPADRTDPSFREFSAIGEAPAGPAEEPIVDATFVSVCAAVLLAMFIMAVILAMGTARPVPGYAVFGAGLFGAVFGAFLMGALHLAVTDSRRHKDDDH